MINQVIENQAKDVRPCEKIVGNESNVTTLANFYEKNATLFKLIVTHKLLEYAQDNEYTKEELEAYRAGLLQVGVFMDKCLVEREQRSQPVPKD